MTLYEAARRNSALRFIDGETATETPMVSLPSLVFDDPDPALVILYCDSTFDTVASFWSVMASPHVVALLPGSLRPQLKASLESRYRPHYIIDAARVDIPGYSRVPSGIGRLFCASQAEQYRVHPSIKVLLSTSGTTGSPKFVKLSEDNLLSNARAIAGYLPLNANDVVPLNLPIHYSYGLSVLTSNAIGGGGIASIPHDMLRPDFWKIFTELGCSSIAGVPYVYEMLKRIGFLEKKYPSLRYLTQAGGRLKDSLIDEYSQYAAANGLSFFVMYGATEATARMSYLEPAEIPSRRGSIGKAIPGGEFSIDVDMGELLYSGPNVFGGYAESCADLQHFESPAWLRTGDLAFCDDDGFYFIKGRIKRIVKLFGNRVNLDDVEIFASESSGCEIRCTGYEDRHLVVWHSSDGLDETAIRRGLQQEYALNPSVIRFMRTDSFPSTASGKVDYMALTEMYHHE